MKKIALYITVFSLLAVGCTEETLLSPYGENDGVAPSPVTNVVVKNFSGGATLKYDLPSDLDLAYVKARYTDSNGKLCETKASSYVDSLVIRGLGEVRDYEVELISYDKFENCSASVNVTISPTTPPVQLVFESLKCSIDFGGFYIEYENVEKADIGIYITRKNEFSDSQEYYDSYFTAKASGSYSVRGLPNVENEFGIYIQDKWNNKSDVFTFTGTPLYESELDKDKFVHVNYLLVPGDLAPNQMYDGNSDVTKLWDGQINNWNYYNSLLDLPFPHRFSIDMGAVVTMSRLKLWQRDGRECVWKHAMWKRFNVYGCKELPDRNAASQENPEKGWTLLGEFESVKPSGSPLGVETDEDMQLAKDGEEFIFPRNIPAVRYLRFEILSAHSPMRSSGMSEIALWGQIENEEENQ